MDSERLRKQTKAVLRVMQCADFDVTIWLTNNSRMKSLNREYRHMNKTTDVLSFDFRNVARGEPPQEYYGIKDLGQLFLSVPRVQEQAQGSLSDELCFLTTHGILHLLGYDDEGTDAEADIMEKENERVFELVRDIL